MRTRVRRALGRWATRGSLPRAAVFRAAWFLIFWLVLAGPDPVDLGAGAVSVVAATWTSLLLLPPGSSRRSPAAIGRLVLLFAGHSIIAGVDVARRALDPRLPLRPGFVTYPVGFPPGIARNAFAALTSLLPGTVPAGEDEEHIVYHCLDIDQAVVVQLAAEEAAFSEALRDG